MTFAARMFASFARQCRRRSDERDSEEAEEKSGDDTDHGIAFPKSEMLDNRGSLPRKGDGKGGAKIFVQKNRVFNNVL